MKKLISNNGGYKMYAELKALPLSKANEVELRFTTSYDEAKDPTDEQVKFQLIMDIDTLEQLKLLIQNSND